MQRNLLLAAVILLLSFLGVQGLPLTQTADKDGGNSASDGKLPVLTVGQSRDLGSADTPGSGSDRAPLRICSFNIQFLGNSTARDDVALASLLNGYDIVAVQELVSPPFAGFFPDGTPFRPDAESAEFFTAMADLGFLWVLSEEDTGTGDTIHRNGSSTEWWVCFYRPGRVQPAEDLPHGFLAEDRSNNPNFERVPYAFAFRTPGRTLDFVLISVHLQPGDGSSDRARRAEELATIDQWIRRQTLAERDFIILGDMNLEDSAEVQAVTPAGFVSLNDECRPTNTNVNGPKPYDHVMYSPTFSGEVDTVFDMQIVNLIEQLAGSWTSTDAYPGDPYDHNLFRAYYSDHHPIVFQMIIPGEDDDGPLRVAETSATVN